MPRTHHIRLSRIMMNLETIVGAYIRGQIITCLLMAIFTFVLLWACGVENALAIAAFAGLADVLPYIGPLFSVGPAVLAATSRGPVIAIVVLLLMLAYEEFESRVLVPAGLWPGATPPLVRRPVRALGWRDIDGHPRRAPRSARRGHGEDAHRGAASGAAR